MDPFDLILWAFAIGITYAVLSSVIPFEKWIAGLIDAAKSRRRERPGSDEPPGD